MFDTLLERYNADSFGVARETIRIHLANKELTIENASLIVPQLMEIPKCGECYQRFDEVIELGRNWSDKQYYCASCLKKALNLLWYE